MKALITPFLIVASDNNQDMEFDLREANIPYKVIDGVYKGNNEKSFLVPLRFEIDILVFAQRHNQESVLVVYADSSAYLIFIKDMFEQPKYVGQWHRTDHESDNCSLIDNEWYTTINDGFGV